MSLHRSTPERIGRAALLGLAAWATTAASAAAQETVDIVVPAVVNFVVTDVQSDTGGWPSVTTVSFSDASLGVGKSLRVSVQAALASFVPPSGASIPATKVSWTNEGASGGEGWDGTLSSASYGLVFQSDPDATSGYVDLAWTLAAPGAGIRGGVHELTIRWKVESITP